MISPPPGTWLHFALPKITQPVRVQCFLYQYASIFPPTNNNPVCWPIENPDSMGQCRGILATSTEDSSERLTPSLSSMGTPLAKAVDATVHSVEGTEGEACRRRRTSAKTPATGNPWPEMHDRASGESHAPYSHICLRFPISLTPT